ncbi:sensor domain-containing diguanylate cyclase [Aquibacillus sediminis]|uniref:sensor domain-containing diguanylate cyclase n=1 Tax=Aquibacillus sediminis TaxID=2574734 RepID=UPI001107CF20|nr:sensor domain-containing diguanylate cyclase [Aquibacillus sediminis]
MITKKKQVVLWLVWLLIWPLSFWVIGQLWPVSIQGKGLDLVAFALLMSIVAFFPLIINNTPVFFVQGVSFAVFLYYGVLIEAMLTQIAILVLMAKIRVGKRDVYRIPLNMLMFLFISVFSASVYKALGGINGEIDFDNTQLFIPVLAYVTTVFLTNHVMLYLIKRFLYGDKTASFKRGIVLVWEFLTTLLIAPVGFTLYMMYVEFGLIAILFVGIPFVSISFVLKLYHTSEKINHYLQRTTELGHELTGQLKVNEVVDVFIKQVTDLFPVDYVFIYDIVENKKIRLVRFYDQAQQINRPPSYYVYKLEAISGMVWSKKQGVKYNSNKEWDQSVETSGSGFGESVVSLPVERDNEVVAVITLVSKKKRAFENYQYMILNIVINHFAVALKNAKNYEQTKSKSERDPLTKLYNFRYLEAYLEDYMKQMEKLEGETVPPVSIILLDIDHFKVVNDTYGHEAGNEILIDLADRLRRQIGNKGVVARYGGEEFVIFLPGIAQSECMQVAEAIRREIADTPFSIQQHILEQDTSIDLPITASIGVATYPDNCEDCVELVRHADRAMYVGAKQKGRNKVAQYK